MTTRTEPGGRIADRTGVNTGANVVLERGSRLVPGVPREGMNSLATQGEVR